eukprot:scaffold83276_cov56-Phaeocystis_antarctica.AAC.2
MPSHPWKDPDSLNSQYSHGCAHAGAMRGDHCEACARASGVRRITSMQTHRERKFDTARQESRVLQVCNIVERHNVTQPDSRQTRNCLGGGRTTAPVRAGPLAALPLPACAASTA